MTRKSLLILTVLGLLVVLILGFAIYGALFPSRQAREVVTDAMAFIVLYVGALMLVLPIVGAMYGLSNPGNNTPLESGSNPAQ